MDLQPGAAPSTSPDADRLNELVQAIREHSAQAGALLLNLFEIPLKRYCFGYLGTIDDAEDALQDITVRVLSASAIPDGTAFRAWLYRVSRNHCLNRIRDKGRRRDSTPLAFDSALSDSLTGNLTRLVREEQRDSIRRAREALDQESREILRLRYVEGLSRTEVAEVMDISVTVVKNRLFQSLKLLREFAGPSIQS